MESDVLQIGRYQLENLIRQDVRFLFIDLRSESERVEFSHPLLAKVLPMQAPELLENLVSNQVPLDAAIVLLDQTGDRSVEIAKELEAKSYKNVYVFRGGAKQLALEST